MMKNFDVKNNCNEVYYNKKFLGSLIAIKAIAILNTVLVT